MVASEVLGTFAAGALGAGLGAAGGSDFSSVPCSVFWEPSCVPLDHFATSVMSSVTGLEKSYFSPSRSQPSKA